MNTPPPAPPNSIPISKYRPSLTASQIRHILCLAKLDMSQESISIIKTLAPFEAKIANNAIDPSFTTTPNLSVEDSLGMDSPLSPHTSDNPRDKVTYNLSCYLRYKNITDTVGATYVTMSLSEIQAAKEHMYVNDLMSETEEAEYEANTGGM